MVTWLAVLMIQCLGIVAPAPRWDAEQDTLPTLEEVLERYVEAVGGREAIERLTTRVMTGRLVTDLPAEKPPFYESVGFVIYAKLPGKYLVEYELSDSSTHRDGYDGRTCWRRPVSGEVELDAHYDRRFAWLIDPRNALRMWDYFPDMKLQGVTTVEGRPAYQVAIDDDVSHTLHFDAETGLLVWLGYNRYLTDYREVDGVLFPFRLEYSRKGGSSTFVIDSVEHNVPIDDAKFAAPIR
jgi:hypothetical protein